MESSSVSAWKCWIVYISDMKLITLQEYLMGRDGAYPDDYTETIAHNAQFTVEQVNALLEHFGWDGHVASGWRPPALNAHTAGASPHSKHMSALACDLHDPDGKMDEMCDEDTLKLFNLWKENQDSTPGWIHIQTVQYGSWIEGKPRTFKP